MNSDRFERFLLLIEGTQKCIDKLKCEFAPIYRIKRVHILWLYRLGLHENGLTAAELAAKSMIDPSLVSREISSLIKDGYVEACTTSGGKRRYNSRIRLTPKGRQIAENIATLAMSARVHADVGISEEELNSFYSTLEKIYENLCVFDIRESMEAMIK